MKSAQDLFADAYRLYAGEEKFDEAIIAAREALVVDPKHYKSRVLLGMMLGDHGGDAGNIESRTHFVKAIAEARSLKEIADSGYECSAIYHLGICELKEERYANAAIFFAMDMLLSGDEIAKSRFAEIIPDLDEEIREPLQMLLQYTHITRG